MQNMHNRRPTLVPVQVEAVTQEELMNAEDLDWDEEVRLLVARMRTKFVSLRKTNSIDECTFVKLLHLQGNSL